MSKIKTTFVGIVCLLFFVKCSDDVKDIEGKNYQTKNDNNIELSIDQISEMAKMHNRILKDIHLNRGDVYLYDENEKLELTRDMYRRHMSGFEREMELEAVINFSRNVARVDNPADLLIYDYEKRYLAEANEVLHRSANLNELNRSLDRVAASVMSDEREMYKTPILLYIETLKESSYYWASVEEGGEGFGFSLLESRTTNSAVKTKRNWRNTAIADAQGMTTGMLGLAAYGAWGVMFGPATFALGAGALVWVAVESAMASALFG
ncbi:hypothetical protein [Myroides odoratus]|uniref:hypothetical protein n=1 Tax=Myroides odoratus TaxID=256 RepID=UPI003341AA53